MKNFFEHQDEARRTTRWLLILMTLGVIAMGVAIYALLIVAARFTHPTSADVLYPIQWIQPRLFGGTLLGTGAIVSFASMGRVLTLSRRGGSGVAEMLGGRLVSGNPRDVLEKRFVNVLEEMSIASGMPVPQAFVLDNETGINAFAAGMATGDAVVAVTRGCLEKLTREELQGVVAHEMSHISHGDMRINMRLMGVVFGIVCIAFLGRLALRAGSSSRGSRRSKDGNAVAMVGLGLLVIGSVGEFFGKLIKAAIGRQREYLADASAVQYTRNPAGIAGALKKIGGFSQGSLVQSARAEEASHMFFGDIHQRFSGLFATHPPLTERIQRVDPSWNGSLPTVAEGIAQPDDAPIAGFAGSSTTHSASDVTASAGTLTPHAVSAAQQWLARLPPVLREGASNAFTASAIAYAMLWSREEATGVTQRQLLHTMVGPALADAAERLVPTVHALPRAHCIALTELLSPGLHALSPDQRARFLQAIRALMDADRHVTLFEHLLGEALATTLSASHGHARRLDLRMVRDELSLLLSLLAQVGAATAEDANAAFQHGAARLPELRLALLPAAEGQLKGLSHCLHALRALAPSASARVLDAMAHCALNNQNVNEHEATLIAATCLALQIPLPAWAA